ncbi:MAG: ribose 5-phosphate isomerase B [Clostridia bacterium]|nr:ribose 5-phosphate isomerase B [Clostridia bacterium]
MTIAIGCDHAGFQLKEKIKDYLESKNLAFEDFGTFDEESVDYPDYAFYVSKAVASGKCEKGILVCGTGIGVGIAANKVPGIRAALCHDLFSAEATREHNDSNVLTMGARVVDWNIALDIVDTWLKTEFAGGRHQRRVNKITAIEDMMAIERAEEIALAIADNKKEKNGSDDNVSE